MTNENATNAQTVVLLQPSITATSDNTPHIQAVRLCDGTLVIKRTNPDEYYEINTSPDGDGIDTPTDADVALQPALVRYIVTMLTATLDRLIGGTVTDEPSIPIRCGSILSWGDPVSHTTYSLMLAFLPNHEHVVQTVIFQRRTAPTASVGPFVERLEYPYQSKNVDTTGWQRVPWLAKLITMADTVASYALRGDQNKLTVAMDDITVADVDNDGTASVPARR